MFKLIMFLRNERTWNNTTKSHEAIACHGLEFNGLDSGRDIFELCLSRAAISQCVKWHPPPVFTFKCNCDAAIFYEGGVLHVQEWFCEVVVDGVVIAYKML